MKNLEQIDVALARGKFTEDLWTDDNYIAEEKLDGERFRLHIFKDGNRLDSRTISKKTNRFTEKTDNVPHLRDFKLPQLEGTVLDGEIVFGSNSMTTSAIMGCLPSEAVKRQEEAGEWVQYHVFDIIRYNGKNVESFPYHKRADLLFEIFHKYLKANPHFRKPKTAHENKKAFCDAIFAAGGEGVVLKNIHAPYTDKTGWVKVKAVKTYDVVVIGYKPATLKTIKKGDDKATISRFAANDWIGALEFGQFINGEMTHLGRCSGMPDDIREDFSRNKEARLGTVITIEAQSRIKKTGKFRHPRFLRIRKDKNAEDCIYYEDEK